MDRSGTEQMVAGRYRLEARLARGGMGEVWRAHDTHTDRPVAVKVAHSGADASATERLRREARMVASLIHPNVVTVLDVTGGEDDDPAIVMELVEGETLADRLAREGALPLPDAVGIADAVLAALEAAHARDIVHRDVTPANVLLSPDGNVKVTDFGIARSPGQTRLTDTGTIVGTAPYLSPEQLLDEAPTPASDQYSAAVVVYELLTGALPFGGESSASVAVARLHADPTPVGKHRPDVPAPVAAVVERALRRQPGDRFASVFEMRSALQAAVIEAQLPASSGLVTAPQAAFAPPTDVLPAGGPETAVATQTLDRPPVGPQRGGPRSRRGLALVIGLVAALAAFTGVAWAQSGGGGVGVIGVPDLVGSDVEAAKQLAGDAGLQVETQEIEDDAPAGTVVDQSVPAGTRVASDTEFTLEVSSGTPPCCTVPELVGLDVEEAAAALRDAGLTVGSVEYQDSDEEIGTVLGQEPDAGSSAATDDAVDLTLSEGDEKDKGEGDDDEGRGPPGLRGRGDD